LRWGAHFGEHLFANYFYIEKQQKKGDSMHISSTQFLGQGWGQLNPWFG